MKPVYCYVSPVSQQTIWNRGFTGSPNPHAPPRSLISTSELIPSRLFPYKLRKRKLMSKHKNVQSQTSWPRVLCEKTIVSVRSQLWNPRGSSKWKLWHILIKSFTLRIGSWKSHVIAFQPPPPSPQPLCPACPSFLPFLPFVFTAWSLWGVSLTS